MFLSKIVTAAIVLTCQARSTPIQPSEINRLFSRDATCSDSSQFVPAITSGQPGASAFCATQWDADYSPITQLTVWWDYYAVTGIQATYSDGNQSPVFGSTNSNWASIAVDYAQGQRWTGWTSYYQLPQYGGTGYITALYISNSQGSTLYAGQTPYQLSQSGLSNYPNTQNVGSGLLFGINGTASGGVESISSLFLSSDLANIQISNVQFPDGPVGSQDISLEALSSAHYYNGQDSGTSMWQFMNSQAIATSHTFTQAVANTYGESVAVGITLDLKIVSISDTTTFMWSTQYTTTNAYQYTDTVTVSWQQSGTLEPGQGVDAVASIGHGSGTFPYTSTVAITLKNGFVFSFEEDGELTIDDISTALVEVTSNNQP